MKKKIFVSVLLLIVGILKTYAFTVAFIYGTVTNSQSGLPIINHTVIITDSLSYTHTLFTGNSGYYNDSIANSSSNPVKYYILTYDCNNNLHFDTVTTTGYVSHISNFSICNIGQDVGIIGITIPSDTSFIAGYNCYPKIKVKNFSTSQVYYIKIGFSINGQIPTITVFNVLYPFFPNDTMTFEFTTPFTTPNSNFTICAFTLNADNNTSNDTLCKNVTILPPPKDAGILSINYPVNSVTSGDTIAPVIQIKNFGTDTLNNIQLMYYINGVLKSTETWYGNLIYDSSASFTFLNKYVVNSTNNIHLLVRLYLNGDYNHVNDSIYKLITVNPAQFDVGISDIIIPSNYACEYQSVYPKVIIKNYGLTALSSIPLSYQKGSLTSPVSETWTGSPLGYGDTVSYTFIVPLNIGSGTSFYLHSFTTLANDANLSNNSIVNQIFIEQYNSNFSILGDDTIVIGQNNVIYHTDVLNTGQYIWTLPPGASVDTAYANCIVVNFANNAQSGNITCKIINICGTSQTIVFPVWVFTTPPPPTIFQMGNTLYSGYSTGNQWYFDNTAIPGANQPTYTPSQTGYYFCKVTINGTTSNVSNIIYVAFAGTNNITYTENFEIFPNPVKDKLTITYNLDKSTEVELNILNSEGRFIKNLINFNQLPGKYEYTFDLENLAKGLYFYNLKTSGHTVNGKFIIVKE